MAAFPEVNLTFGEDIPRIWREAEKQRSLKDLGEMLKGGDVNYQLMASKLAAAGDIGSALKLLELQKQGAATKQLSDAVAIAIGGGGQAALPSATGDTTPIEAKRVSTTREPPIARRTTSIGRGIGSKPAYTGPDAAGSVVDILTSRGYTPTATGNFLNFLSRSPQFRGIEPNTALTPEQTTAINNLLDTTAGPGKPAMAAPGIPRESPPGDTSMEDAFLAGGGVPIGPTPSPGRPALRPGDISMEEDVLAGRGVPIAPAPPAPPALQQQPGGPRQFQQQQPMRPSGMFAPTPMAEQAPPMGTPPAGPRPAAGPPPGIPTNNPFAGKGIAELLIASLNPSLPQGSREFAKILLQQALNDPNTKLSDVRKNFIIAKSEGYPGDFVTYQRTVAAPTQITEIYSKESGAPQKAAVNPDGTITPIGGEKKTNIGDLPAGDRKAILDAEKENVGYNSSLKVLEEALQLNPLALTGYLAGTRSSIATKAPFGIGPTIAQTTPEAAKATERWKTIMSPQAMTRMSETLKGATTDREMARFLEVMADVNADPEVRKQVLETMIMDVRDQMKYNTQLAEGLRGRTYYKPGSGPAAAPAAAAPGPRAPAAAPAGRPGEAVAGGAAPSAAAIDFLKRILEPLLNLRPSLVFPRISSAASRSTLMSNIYDQFDQPKAGDVSPVTGKPYIEVGGKPAETTNVYDQFDPPKMGAMQAGIEGAKRGATFNFWDELSGAFGASGVPDMLKGLPEPLQRAAVRALAMNPLTAAGTLGLGTGRIAGEQVFGGDGATKTYEKARDEARKIAKQAQKDQPGAYLTGEIAGSVATPIPGLAAARGASIPVRAAYGAAAGGASGTLSGLGEGEDLADRLTKGAVGGVLGGTIGAAAPPVLTSIGRTAQYFGRPIVTAVQGAFQPAREASRRIVRMGERDIEADPGAVRRMLPGEFAAARAEGTPVANIDLFGTGTRKLADVAATASPEGSEVLNQALSARFTSQSPRIRNWLNETFSYPNPDAQRVALDEVERTVNRTRYQRAYREGDRQVWSPRLERLTSSPGIVAAMGDAATKGKDRAVAQGFGGFNPGVVVENGMVRFQRGQTGVPTYPNLQFWDYTKRAIDDSAKAARRQGRDSEGDALEQLSRQLRAELDTIVPSYAEARAGAHSFFGAENALEAGEKFVNMKHENAPTRRVLASMSPTERELFRDGFVGRMMSELHEAGDNSGAVLSSLIGSGAKRERLNIALGPQRARELEATLRVENIMDMARKRVQGNSWTAQRLYDLGMAGGAGGIGYGGYSMDPQAVAYGSLVTAFSKFGKRLDERVLRHVAEQLASSDPTILQRGMNIVTRNNRFMDALRAADPYIARIIGQQAPDVAPTGGVSRADEKQ